MHKPVVSPLIAFALILSVAGDHADASPSLDFSEVDSKELRRIGKVHFVKREYRAASQVYLELWQRTYEDYPAGIKAGSSLAASGDLFAGIRQLESVIDHMVMDGRDKGPQWQRVQRELSRAHQLKNAVERREQALPDVRVLRSEQTENALSAEIEFINNAPVQGRLLVSIYTPDRDLRLTLAQDTITANGTVKGRLIAALQERDRAGGSIPCVVRISVTPDDDINGPVSSKRQVTLTWAGGLTFATYQTPPDPRWKHLSVALRGSYGGFWVPDNRPAQLGQREPTTTRGLGLRVAKGFSQYLAVEGEIAGGTTGVAEFEPGMTRSGRYGRVIVQGVARYGKEWVGSVRLGTGLQVASYESSQPDMQGTDIEALYALGFGFQRRVQNFSVGLYGDYVEGLNSGASAVAIGLQAGYGWTL